MLEFIDRVAVLQRLQVAISDESDFVFEHFFVQCNELSGEIVYFIR